MKKQAITIIAVTLLNACATHTDILKNGPYSAFTSKLSPLALAVCIDRNADSYALGSLRSKVVNTGKEPIEVVILNGPAHWAIAHIKTMGTGSSADFYLGGGATITPKSSIEAMTLGCE
ncbi:MAG: hypothetical protein NT086_19735 [Proteobacteria bacterium]|nr:hypothetical protein [Pseudomonadota bacterium]